MNINENTTYKFERKFSNKDTYHVKLTKEILEDLENCQNINEVILNVNENIGTFTIQSRNNSAKVFNLNIEPITRGEKESLELNMFRSNRTIESIAPLNVRLNVQATSKIYDMTKKKIVEVADENKKHCAKELKMVVCPNKNSLAYSVFQNKEDRKSEANSRNQVTNRPPSTTMPNKSNLVDNKKLSQFTIREKVLHLLALKPASKDIILLNLHRLGVTSTDRAEVEKHLNQIASLNRENLYQLSSQFVLDIRDDWPQFSDDNRRIIAKLKLDAKLKLQNPINSSQIVKHSSNGREIQPGSVDKVSIDSQKVPQYSSHTQTTALNMLATGKSLSETCRILNIPEKLLNSWKSSQTRLREPENKRPVIISAKSHRSDRHDTISPAESNSSSKTVASNDEGFVSGDKRTPLKLPNSSHSNKRHSQHSIDDPDCKKMRTSDKKQSFTHNDSSSSCDVTPRSDVSLPSNTYKSKDPRLEFNGNTVSESRKKTNCSKTDIDDTQDKFNIAFEEYTQLCSKLKERETEIGILRSKCNSAKKCEYARIYKSARSLLDQLETPEFQKITVRVKTLESEMCAHVRILTGQLLN